MTGSRGRPRPQLQTCLRAAAQGRRHRSGLEQVQPRACDHRLRAGQQTRAAADAAVKALRWTKPYFLDADHIRLETVDRFLPHADFYTIDVADWIGQPAPAEAVARFLAGTPN